MKKLLLLTTLALLTSCAEKKTPNAPTDDDLKDDLQYKGRISGLVTNLQGENLSGVSITTTPEGYTTQSDSLGAYTIPDVKGGTYKLDFRLLNHADTSIAEVNLAIDEDKSGVDMEMRFLPDSNIINLIDSTLQSRDIVGSLTEFERLSTVELQAFDTEGDSIPVSVATWESESMTYSSKLKVPKKGGKLVVSVRDAEKHLVGRSKISIDASINQINIPSFRANNALPSLDVPQSITLIAGVTHELVAISKDTVGESVGVKEVRWALGSDEFKVAPQGKLSVTIPSSSVSAIAEVEDLDGNVVRDSFAITVSQNLELIDVKAGSFTSGGSGNGLHKPFEVTLTKDFQLGKYEITNVEFVQFLNEQSSPLVFNELEVFSLDNPEITQTTDGFELNQGYEKYPVRYVSWVGAVLYVNWLSTKNGYASLYTFEGGEKFTLDTSKKGFRLPSAAEWEFAAKGGIGSQGYIYAGSNTLSDVAQVGALAEVGQKFANELGLFDMTGNVSEWTHDIAVAAVEGAKLIDPMGGVDGWDRTVLGGYASGDESKMRLGSWRYLMFDNADASTGFRILLQNP